MKDVRIENHKTNKFYGSTYYEAINTLALNISNKCIWIKIDNDVPDEVIVPHLKPDFKRGEYYED